MVQKICSMHYAQVQFLRCRKSGIRAMLHIPHPPRQIVTFGVLGILLLVLSACGPRSSSTTTGSGPGSPTATTTPTRPINGSAYGCPSNTVVSTAPTKANVIIQNTDLNSTVTAHVGDTVEVRLPFGQKWSGPASVSTNFQQEQPAGYAFTPDKVCVWRFVAQSAGMTSLDFFGRALCLKGTMCPMYVIDFSFTIDVK